MSKIQNVISVLNVYFNKKNPIYQFGRHLFEANFWSLGIKIKPESSVANFIHSLAINNLVNFRNIKKYFGYLKMMSVTTYN